MTVQGTRINDLTQKASVNVDDLIMVLDGEDAKLVKVGLLQGSSNLTEEYAILKNGATCEKPMYI